MATMTSTYVWLHDATDLGGDQLQLECASWASPPAMDGDVRRRAAGRTVAVTRPGVTRTATITLRILDRDSLEWLIAHIGTLILARGPRGDRIWGTYFAVDYGEVMAFEFPLPATIHVAEVTTTEVV